MVKKQKINEILCINLDKEMNSILNKVGDLDKIDFKSNFIAWRIRQAILKAMLKRSKKQ